MKVSLKWLKDYVDIDLSPAEAAHRLTMAGLEVKDTQVIGAGWDRVVIGQIKEINPHPNADRLKLPTIDLGKEEVTVVCGAPNLRLGDKVAFAKEGAELIDGHTGQPMKLKPAKIRGFVSHGMVCSERELGLSDDHTGIMVLPTAAPVGTPLADYLGDAIFNMEITPNRPDCLSMIGIARELAALTGRKVELPNAEYPEQGPPVDEQISVDIMASDLCPRYCAALVKGVKISESPSWMQQRLIAGGMRPINNVVDITNYVMLEFGQPLHSFDYDCIRGKKIIVRRAGSGEKITTLDGTDRQLAPDVLVIADSERAVAVAGVMGGGNTEVTDATTSILLEAANFNPSSVHYTGRTLGLPSEACMRFERGIRPEIALPALKRATQLMVELGGGEVARGIVDVYPGKKESESIRITTERVRRVLGVELNRDVIAETLESLGFDCRADGDDALVAMPPYWRSDIRIPEDIVEEIARVRGYDEIPTTMLSQPIPRQNPLPIMRLKRVLRNELVGLGFQEVVTPSLTAMEMLRKITAGATEPDALRLYNPMTSDQEYLRPTLRATVLSILAANQRFEEGGIRLFEMSHVFLPRGRDLPEERDMLCGVISGPWADPWWRGRGEAGDVFHAKGVVESLLRRLGVEAGFEASQDDSLRLDYQAAVKLNGANLGIVGEVLPIVRDSFEITGPVYLFEIDLPALLALTGVVKAFRPIPRFPAVVRDIAVVVGVEISHAQALDIVNSFSLVDKVLLFDVYSGDQVPPGKKSLAYRVTYQSTSKTLTDEEVNGVQQEILARLESELGATLRK